MSGGSGAEPPLSFVRRAVRLCASKGDAKHGFHLSQVPIDDEARLRAGSQPWQPHAGDMVEGEPQRSIWVGLKSVRAQDHEIESWRCTSAVN